MAQNVIEVLLKARDEASGVLHKAAGEVGNLSGAFGRISSAAGTLGIVAGAAVAVGAAALGMAKSVADSVEQLDRLSTRTGVSTKNLQILQQIVKEGGGDVGSLTTAFSFLNRAIANNEPLIKALGITTRAPLQVMLKLGDAFRASEDAASKNAVAFKLLGRGGAELIADVAGLPEAWSKNRQAMIDAGLVFDEMTKGHARQLDQEMDQFSRNFEGAMNRIKAATLPTINALIEYNKQMLNATFGGSTREHGGGGKFGAMKTYGPAFDPLAAAIAATQADGAGGKRNKSFAEIYPQGFGTAFQYNTDLKPITQFGQQFSGAQVAQPGTRNAPFQQALGDWRTFTRQLTDTAGTLNAAFEGLWSGLEGGFSQAFAQIAAGTATFSSVMTATVQSLVSSMLQQLAGLAAAGVFKLFLQLVGLVATGGGSAGVSLVGATVGAATGGLGFTPGGFGGGAGSNAARAMPGGVNVHIVTMDGASVERSFSSPNGSGRRAMERLALAGSR